MSYEHRCLMRRRLELYHDLLTEQLRPRIEAAAAATTENENPDSGTDQYIDDDTDNSDDTDDSDEDLREWDHAENKSSEESYARVTQWRCGLERNKVCETDALNHCGQTEEGSGQVDLRQQDNKYEACLTAEVRHIEQARSGTAADMSMQNLGGPLAPLLATLPLNHMAKNEEQGQADDGETASSSFETTEREASNIPLPDQGNSSSEASKDDFSNKFNTPPSSSCRESSVTASPVPINKGNDPTSLLRQSNLINQSQPIPTTLKLSQSPRRSKSLPPLNFFPSRCPPTPPPDTSSSTSTYSPLRFTVTPAQLEFFYEHIHEVEYMIRGIDYQFQMHEYRDEVRRQNRRRRIRTEVEERMRIIEWNNDIPGEDWGSVTGMDETELVEESAEEIGQQSWENDTVVAVWDTGGLEGNQPTDTEGEGDDDPSSYEPGGVGDGCATDGHGEEDDSVWVDGAGDENAAAAADGSSSDETGWNCAWSSTCLESEKKTQPHQPTKSSSLRKEYTPDDMVWEEAVAEAEYLKSFGHHFKKDKRGRRYWRL
ncbi:uncharacterized protein B0T23DRAFT_16981 [Neurospora hispaniola]|uniref:Uncharacterized protein n=1 Tax=Neurospora hispaniola TaxID=588809 RepID=A0AAJ0MV79_9PEZI|nr:hypothetical protein B0T23DRAFT_16981 [Neurospora hispaniola]